MTNNELMSVKQPDRTAEDLKQGVAENILRRQDMRMTIVEVTFTPKRKKVPAQPPRRWKFHTAVLANEFIERVCPPPGKQLGSIKQSNAKRAKLVNLQPHMFPWYEIKAHIVGYGESVPVGEDTGGVELTEDDVVDTFVENEAALTDPDETSSVPADDVETFLNEVDPQP